MLTGEDITLTWVCTMHHVVKVSFVITKGRAQVTESLGRDVEKDQLPKVLQGLQQWWVLHNAGITSFQHQAVQADMLHAQLRSQAKLNMHM